MVLFLLRDKTCLPVPDCVNVIHKFGCLICLDQEGAPILSMADAAVLAYTFNAEVVRAFESTGLDSIDEPEPALDNVKVRRFRQRR